MAVKLQQKTPADVVTEMLTYAMKALGVNSC